MWSLLADRTVRTVWLGEVVNEFGNALNYWALAWLLFRAYPTQPWVAASVLSAQAVGLLVGATLLGPNLDRWNRRHLLVGSNWVLAGLVALIPAAIRLEAGLVGLLILALLIGIATSLTVPALQATLPSLAPPERLQPLQALFGLTFSLSSLAAPLCAGLLIAALGAATVMWVNAVTFAFAGACYLLVRFPPQLLASRPQGSAFQQWLEQAREGLGFVRSRAAVWGIILMVASQNAFADPYNSLFLPRMTERLFAGVHFPSWLGSDPQAAGLGLFDTVVINTEFLATLWLGGRSFSNPLSLRYLIAGCLLAALGMLGAVLAPNLLVSLMFCAVQGLGFAPIGVLAGTLLGRLVPEEIRGRVGSVRLFLGQGLRPVALSAVGALITPVGVPGVAVALFLTVVALVRLGARRAAKDLPAASDSRNLGG